MTDWIDGMLFFGPKSKPILCESNRKLKQSEDTHQRPCLCKL